MTHALIIAALFAVPVAICVVLWFALALAGMIDEAEERRTGERRS